MYRARAGVVAKEMMESMKKGVVLLLSLVLLPISVGLRAAEVKGLYEAEMLVPDQSRSERGLAMSAALAEVVTRVSGRPDARLQPAVAAAIRQPARLLQQYRYRPLPPALRDAALPGSDPQRILFHFDRRAVDRLLRDNGLPVWGATRPTVLAWVAVEDEEGRRLLAADTPDPLRRALIDEARRLGLPLILPLMDLQDTTRVSLGDVWGRFMEPLRQASQRYRPEVVLLLRLYRGAGGDWQADWRVDQDGVGEQWHSDGALAEEAVSAGMSRLLAWLSARYAPQEQTTAGHHLIFSVQGVRDLTDFARVERYLRSLQQVAVVRPQAFADDRVDFALVLQGSEQGLVQTIALGRLLVPVTEAPAAVAQSAAGRLIPSSAPTGQGLETATAPGSASPSPAAPPNAVPSPTAALTPRRVYRLQH